MKKLVWLGGIIVFLLAAMVVVDSLFGVDLIDRLFFQSFARMAISIGKEKIIACGCGCCVGVTPKPTCVFSRGELEKLKNESGPDAVTCGLVGCSRWITYVYCGL